MRFTVTWTDEAQNELADIWLLASNRQSVTDAANELDRLLQIDAHHRGQECDGDRMIVVAPLIAFFSVSIGDRLVEIISVAQQ